MLVSQKKRAGGRKERKITEIQTEHTGCVTWQGRGFFKEGIRLFGG
jgi:hypothetical protein